MLSWGPMPSRDSSLLLWCCLLLMPLGVRAEVLETPARDDWLGQDKALHYSVSAGLAGAGYAAGALLFDAPEARWLTGAGGALGAGVAKELFDAARGSFFSWKDLTWDVLGVATGLGLAWAVDRLVASPPAPREARGGLAASLRLSLALTPSSPGHPQGGARDDRKVTLLVVGGW